MEKEELLLILALSQMAEKMKLTISQAQKIYDKSCVEVGLQSAPIQPQT